MGLPTRGSWSIIEFQRQRQLHRPAYRPVRALPRLQGTGRHPNHPRRHRGSQHLPAQRAEGISVTMPGLTDLICQVWENCMFERRTHMNRRIALTLIIPLTLALFLGPDGRNRQRPGAGAGRRHRHRVHLPGPPGPQQRSRRRSSATSPFASTSRHPAGRRSARR